MARLNTDLIRYRISIAEQEGAKSADILATANAPAQLMTGEPAYADDSVERAVWEAIVHHTGREDIGLACGQRFPTQVISLIGYVMANAPTMRVAIEKYCTYQRVIGDTMGMTIEEGPDTSIVRIDQWSEWHDSFRYTIDMFMAAIPSWASANALHIVRPLEVGFKYTRPRDSTPYQEMFAPAPVTFDNKSSYQIYDNAVLDQPVIGANMAMFGYFEEKSKALLTDYEGRDTFTYKTRKRIIESLQGVAPTIDSVANELAVSVRRLQEKLSTEGTRFSTLLSEARRDLAIQYLKEKQVNKAEIAYLLGYSEMSVFSRSFKKWTGMTPSEYESQNHISQHVAAAP